ncbi:MAG TPA: hypothetical protein VF068_00060 [Rubrobacter sp.]
MRERLEQRLAELRAEFERGQQALDELETQATTVRQTLLRISGAIQVLEEELGDSGHPQENGSELSVEEDKTGPAAASRRG